MLKHLYKKSKVLFSIIWIIAYCILFSLADSLSATLGIEKTVTLPVGLALSLFLFLFLRREGLLAAYGLRAPRGSGKQTLYYLPLVALLSANLWYGVTLRYSALETVLFIASMLCVGFLEEVIFRGLLFNAMRGEHPRAAVIVSSVTFGIGHIINLFNGAGADLVPNLLQVVYATAAGFMFVMLYLCTQSLLPCILTHALFNALSAFSREAPTLTHAVLSCVLLCLISGGYAAYLAFILRRRDAREKKQKETYQ